MNTKMQFEAMERALPYAAELMDSEALQNAKKQVQGEKDMGSGAVMTAILPVFLQEKREAVFGLLGALCGKTAEEIESQEWSETKKLMESPILDDLYGFFIFSARMTRHA